MNILPHIRSGTPSGRIARCLLLAGALLVLAAPAAVHAQVRGEITVTDTLQEVHLADGSVLFGRVVEVQGDRIVLVTEAGARVELERAQIRSLRPVRGTVSGGEVRLDDPNLTRLLFAPTGRSLSRGEGYVGLFELFFSFVSYGATDWLTLSAGTPIIPEGMGEVFYLAPKVRVLSMPRVDVSAGVLALFVTEEIDAGSLGILYGVGTFGSADRAVTVGAGWPFIAGEGEDELSDEPILLLGGETRTSRHSKLITENYFLWGERGAILSGGLRLFGERFSADVGIGAWLGVEESGCCLPLLNLVYNFGKR